MKSKPILWIVIPCYNEQEVLPITAPLFSQKLVELTSEGKIAENSRVLFVNDGSRDETWRIITELAKKTNILSGFPKAEIVVIRMQFLPVLWRQRIVVILPFP